MRLTENDWVSLIEDVSDTLGLDSSDMETIRSFPLFRLATAIPYFAGSSNMRREAAANLALILMMSLPGRMKKIFAHCFSDNCNPLERLSIFIRPSSGNLEIQKRAVALLSLVMLNDYQTDKENDELLEKYNPLISHDWQYESIKQELVDLVLRVDCPEMEEVFPLSMAFVTTYWWVG